MLFQIKTTLLLSFALILAVCQLSYAQETEDEDPLEGLRRNIPGEPGKGVFIYDVRCFWAWGYF